jgi:AAA family ATPase
VVNKYISKGHITLLGGTGRSPRKFRVRDVEVSTKANARGTGDVTQLANGLTHLALSEEDAAPVYEMDWRTKVYLEVEVPKADTVAEKVKTTTINKTTSSSTPSYINLYTPSTSSTDSSYSRLGGLGPQIEQIKSLLDLPLLHPELYTLFSLTPPKGILLHGPPGTGKTALARAIASSNPNCSCIVVNGPELSSAYHGESEERLRGVFEEAAKRSPCIVVIDEIDALCPRRDGDGGEVEKRMVATLLTLLDGVGKVEGERVFVIGATNRPNSIDPALRRPGRFDREIEIGESPCTRLINADPDRYT